MSLDEDDGLCCVCGHMPHACYGCPDWVKAVVRLLVSPARKGEGAVDVVRRLISENKEYAETITKLNEVRALLGEEAFPGENLVDVVQRLIRNGGGQWSANNPHDPSGTLCEPLFSALTRMEVKKRDEVQRFCEHLARDVAEGKTDGVVEAAILDDMASELRVLQSAPTILRSADACNRRPR